MMVSILPAPYTRRLITGDTVTSPHAVNGICPLMRLSFLGQTSDSSYSPYQKPAHFPFVVLTVVTPCLTALPLSNTGKGGYQSVMIQTQV